MSNPISLVESSEHFSATHERWIKRIHWDRYAPDAKEEWFGKQCLTCRYYIPLSGVFREDWGACSNGASPLDGTIRFEHDGCEYYDQADVFWTAK